MLGAALAILAATGWWIYGGGRLESAGQVHPEPVPPAVVAARAERQVGAPPGGATQILFGDLHVHTTFSADAFLRSIPLLHGEGSHPPADACDFARYCSGLDFFALTDHAESLTPRSWRETRESIRQCNAVAGDPTAPDLVAFTGFEWSQVGATPEQHYGHKNVIFSGLADDELPTRPIASSGLVATALSTDTGIGAGLRFMVPLLEFPRRQRYLDLDALQRAMAAVPPCPEGPPRALPDDCREVASTPRELFDKLDDWGFDSLVIPHGTTWGFYTPPGYSYDQQLAAAQHDPARQRLIEIYSGHGNSEQYRPWRAVERGPAGEPVCPAPSPGYEPCCWRAGELIRARCGDAPADECEHRVERARAAYLEAGVAGQHVIPGAPPEDWQGCGQCTDCFNPAFQYRPGGSVQYILARGNLDEHAFGFIGSSDNHTARPGTGYKEYARRMMTEAAGPRDATWRARVFPPPGERAPEARALDRAAMAELPPFLVIDVERQASYFMTGGLVAVHSAGRDRASIWDALKRREVYATSGERILLWFDFLAPDGGRAPMGSSVEAAAAPRFRVRAAGAFEQRPGCPAHSAAALSPARLERLCAGECFNPGDRRRRITRIEVVRIRPRRSPDEPIESLIDDPWQVLGCPADAEVCEHELEDPAPGRDALYYVRAIQEPTPAVNAGGERCSQGRCEPCFGDDRTAYEDDCLSLNEERAWSSPIFVGWRGEAAP
jgi:hypothetical protein